MRTRASNRMPLPRLTATATCLVGLLVACTPGQAGPLATPTPLLPDTPVWVVRNNAMQPASDLELSPDGSVVYIATLSKVMVRGILHGAPTVSAYDAVTGSRRWRFSSRSIVGDTNAAPTLALSPDGLRVYMQGTIQHGRDPDGSPDADIATWALKARSGDNLWYQRYDGPPRLSDFSRDVIAKDDLVVATGSTYRKGGLDSDLWLRAYGARNGTVRWTRIYSSGKRADPHGHEDANDHGVALAFANSGNTVIVTGATGKPTNSILTIAVATATGSVRWIRRATHPVHDDGIQRGLDVAVDRGRSFVAGYSDEIYNAEPRPVALAHRIRDGHTEWVRGYPPIETQFGSADSVAVHPASGAPIFAGGGGNARFQLWSLLPTTGALRWDSEDVGTGYPYEAIMDPAGSIVYGAGVIDTDAVVVGYDATDGSALWKGIHAEDGYGWARVVRASTDHVFIGGAAAEDAAAEENLFVAAFAAP